MSEDNAFKNFLGKDAATQLADQIGAAWQAFDKRRFVKLATNKLGDLEPHDPFSSIPTPRMRRRSRRFDCRARCPRSVRPGVLERR